MNEAATGLLVILASAPAVLTAQVEDFGARMAAVARTERSRDYATTLRLAQALKQDLLASRRSTGRRESWST